MDLFFHTLDVPVRMLRITGRDEDLIPLSSLLSLRRVQIFDITPDGVGVQYFRGDA